MKASTAYEIPYSATEPALKVKFSANAWWMNQFTVARFIAALELGKSLPDACVYAKITLRQYKYFLKEHPEFNLVRNYINYQLTKRIERTVIERAEVDGQYAFKYLERVDPSFYRKKWIGFPYCMDCKKEISVNKIPHQFRSDYQKMITPTVPRDPRNRFSVKRKEKPKKETPLQKSQREITEKLEKIAIAVEKKKEQELYDSPIEKAKRNFEEYKKRHNLPKDMGYK